MKTDNRSGGREGDMDFNPVPLIIKKRNGEQLTKQELEFMFNSFSRGDLPDYQMAAFLMAIFFREMNIEEIKTLTGIYINSGDRIRFPENLPTVDKHSTGGVGDKISIILAPLVAACGGIIPMISGRGLSHTGGTLDKLESIPGFRTDLSSQQFRDQVEKIGVAIIGQSQSLVPVDRVTYALRDVTGTVESLPLITASIMSKKIAEGARNLVIDLKVGSGAFLKNMEIARKLGDYLMQTGISLGQKISIVFTNMNSPLGNYVGNALEIRECIEFLQGRPLPDLDAVTRALAREMLKLSGLADDPETADRLLDDTLQSGRALNKLKELIESQGGDPSVCDDPGLLPSADYRIPIISGKDGWIRSIDCEAIGHALIDVRAGRRKLEAELDHSTGAWLPHDIGDRIEKGEEIGQVHCNDKDLGTKVAEKIADAYETSETEISRESLIYEIIDRIN